MFCGHSGGLPAQVVDDASQAEPGACAFLPLIQDESGFGIGTHETLDVVICRVHLRQRIGRRRIGAVAQILRVTGHIERGAARRDGSRLACRTGQRQCGSPHFLPRAECVGKTIQPVAAAIDDFTRGFQVVLRERGLQLDLVLVEISGQQAGGDFRRAGAIRVVRERYVEDAAVSDVIAEAGQLHITPPAIARPIAGILVAQLVFVGAESGLAGQRVEVRRQFGNRHKALGLGAYRAQCCADHILAGQAKCRQRRRHIRQISGDAGCAGEGKQLAHRGGVYRYTQLRGR